MRFFFGPHDSVTIFLEAKFDFKLGGNEEYIRIIQIKSTLG